MQKKYILFTIQQKSKFNNNNIIIVQQILAMQGKGIQKLHTNSCIELSIPHEYRQWGPIKISWFAMPMRGGQSYVAQYLSYQSGKERANEQLYYICSPLDIGSIIYAKIEQQRENQNIVLQQLKYGPVQVQENLLAFTQPGQWRYVDVLVNRNVKQPAELYVKQGLNKYLGEQNYNSQINIIIKMLNTEFTLTIAEHIAKYQFQSFQKQPFFKLFDSQPNALSIYLMDQHKQFIQRMRSLNANYTTGNYLKIYFANRFCRDVFLLYIISLSDIPLENVRQFKTKFLQHQQTNKIKQIKIIEPESKQKKLKPFKQLPKIQSTVRKSQIGGLQFLNTLQIESEAPKNQQDILQDIYNILYTPITKVERESIHIENNLSYPKVEQKSLPSGFTFSINGTLNPDDSQQNQSTNTASNTKTEQTYNNTNSNGSKQQVSASCQINSKEQKMFSQNKDEQLKKNKLGKKFSHQLHDLKNKQKQKKQYTHTSSLKNQTELVEKINQLTKFNQYLLNENKKLKQENQRLKLQNPKAKKQQELNKMIQIKEMVQLMAKKIQNLQQNSKKNQNQQKKGFKFLSYNEEFNKQLMIEKVKKQKEGVLIQNKNIWSPETHKQIMRNLKFKNTQNPRSPKKQQPYSQIQRKISTTDRIIQPPHFSPVHKPEIKVLKQCSSAGDLTNPMSWNIEAKKKIKPKIEHTSIPSNYTQFSSHPYPTQISGPQKQLIMQYKYPYENNQNRNNVQSSPNNQHLQVGSQFFENPQQTFGPPTQFRNVFRP